jgi:hypothetical protein
MVRWDIAQLSCGFTEEMVVVVGIGIEIRAPGLDHGLP